MSSSPHRRARRAAAQAARRIRPTTIHAPQIAATHPALAAMSPEQLDRLLEACLGHEARRDPDLLVIVDVPLDRIGLVPASRAPGVFQRVCRDVADLAARGVDGLPGIGVILIGETGVESIVMGPCEGAFGPLARGLA